MWNSKLWNLENFWTTEKVLYSQISKRFAIFMILITCFQLTNVGNVMANMNLFLFNFFLQEQNIMFQINFYVDFITIFLIRNLLKFNILLNLMLK